MAAMSIYGKNHLIVSSLEPDILNQGLKVYKVCRNDAPLFTLTNLIVMSSFKICFWCFFHAQISIPGEHLRDMQQFDLWFKCQKAALSYEE